MRSALVIGGTGLIGRAVARRLVVAGWQVTVTGRQPHRMPNDLAAGGVQLVLVDRDDPQGLAAAFGAGHNVVIDCVCFTRAQAQLLLPLLRDVDSTIMISSRAVYVDDDGNHVNSTHPPRFAGPITEQQPTPAPGDMPYESAQGYGPNKVAAERTLLDSGLPITVLRPAKVHGEGTKLPSEWYFVKRVMDRRPNLLLAGGGLGIDHPSAAANIAALIDVVANKPGRRILNAADPDTPNGLDIARVIAAAAGHTWQEILLDHNAPTTLGRHPWHRIPPIVLDTRAATELGYEPVGDYASTIHDQLVWMLNQSPVWTPLGYPVLNRS